MPKFIIELIVECETMDEASDWAVGIADASQAMIGAVKRAEPKPQRPMAHEVELKVGDIVYWDDRDGWKGIVTELPSSDTLSVKFKNGQSDQNIGRRMFTKEAIN